MSRPPRFLKLTPPPELETPLHKEILAALRQALPAEWLIVHVPNGFYASPAEWNRMLALGALAGWPDLTIFGWGRAWTLEVKTSDGTENEAQEKLAPRLAAAGIPRAVVRSPLDAILACRMWGMPVRRLYGVELRVPPVPQLPPGFATYQREWELASKEAGNAWASCMCMLPPEQWINAERLGAERRLFGLQTLSGI